MKAQRQLGAHMSISGGLHNALMQGERTGCTAIQIFTKNNNQWNAKPINNEEVERFQSAIEKTHISVPLAHCSYLINLASPKPDLQKKSFDAMVVEVQRASKLNIPYLVLHPGSHTGTGARAGIERIANSINTIHEKQETKHPTILLECMAGQGSSLGSKLEELAEMLELIRDHTRIGICIDTCHLFAAGYDIRTDEVYSAVFKEIEKQIGLEWIKAFHLNDSKKGLGCRVDRHEHIGQGAIGLEAFRLLLNDPRFLTLPMILETPKSADDAWDIMNMTTLRNLIHSENLALTKQ